MQLLRSSLVLITLFGLAACGGGGGGIAPVAAAPLNPGVNLSGNYNLLLTVSTTSNTGNCTEPVGATNPQPDVRQVVHDVATGQVTFDAGSPDAITGKLDGARVTMTFVTPIPNTNFSTTITFAADGSSFAGTYSFAEVGVPVPCSETGTSVGTKIIPPVIPQLNPGVDLTSVFFSTTEVTATTGTCADPLGFKETSNLAITHDAVAGTILINPGTPEALQGTLNGAVATLALVTANPAVDVSATITFAADGTSFSGAMNVMQIGGATPCSQTLSMTGTRGSQLNPGLSLTGVYNFTLQVTEVTGGCTTVGAITTDSFTVDHDLQSGGLIIDSATTTPFVGILNGAQITLTSLNPAVSAVFRLTFAPNGATFAGSTDVLTGAPNPCSVTSRASGTRTAGGVLRVELIWNNDMDLDLSVTEPDLNVLNRLNTVSNPTPSGGTHSGDSQPCGSSDPREESAAWSYGPLGTYQVEVRSFASCAFAQAEYQVQVTYRGAVIFTDIGIILPATTNALVSFTVPGD